MPIVMMPRLAGAEDAGSLLPREAARYSFGVQAVLMLRVQMLDHLRLVIPVPQADVSDVPNGTTVTFSVPAGRDWLRGEFPAGCGASKVLRAGHEKRETSLSVV